MQMGASFLKNMIKEAMQYQQHGEFDKAKNIYAKVLETEPGHADALHLYGLACHQQGDHKTAVNYIRQAIELEPNQPVLRNNLGDALRKAGDLEVAAEQFNHALKLKPDYPGAHQNLGAVYLDSGHHRAALFHAWEAVRLEPKRAEAWFNLGLIQLDHVLLEESVESFRSALAIRPKYPAAVTGLLYTLNLLPGADPGMIAEEHLKVATVMYGTAQPDAARPESSMIHQGTRIRIGFVSGEFCAHAVNYFFEPILKHHNIAQFDTYCYSDVEKSDAVTQRLRRYAQHWQDIVGWPDAAVCERIKSDRINILVDLAGHTKYSRLGVFALKPAPYQISYLGYPGTTGLESMDYRIVDETTAPGEEEPLGTEALLRMQHGFACFHPPAHAPSVQPAPLLRKGHVTLGCLHKLEKVSRAVIEVWAAILRRNPDTRLLVARDELDGWHQQRIQNLFSEHGIQSDRLDLIHFNDPEKSFLQLFSEIDVLLDTFPWSGHTMACMALWMGVPVVSLYGNRHAGRMVASVLNIIGLNDLVAHDVESYIRRAGELCNDPRYLIELRAGLRERLESSPIRDEEGFTRKFEAACRRIVGSKEPVSM